MARKSTTTRSPLTWRLFARVSSDGRVCKCDPSPRSPAHAIGTMYLWSDAALVVSPVSGRRSKIDPIHVVVRTREMPRVLDLTFPTVDAAIVYAVTVVGDAPCPTTT